MQKKEEMDVVFPVGPSKATFFGLYTLPYAIKFFTFKSIYIVASARVLEGLREKVEIYKGIKIHFLDEDRVLKGVTLGTINSYFIEKIGVAPTNLSAWMFQQCLKMGISSVDSLSDRYLIWDADNVPLVPMTFIKDGKPIVSYLNSSLNTSMKNLEDLDYIVEHFLFDKRIMKELIKKLSGKSVEDRNWVVSLLDKQNIQQVQGRLCIFFSEYQEYAEYLLEKYPGTFILKKACFLKHGTVFLGKRPRHFLLKWAASRYDYIRMEPYNPYAFLASIRFALELFVENVLGIRYGRYRKWGARSRT